MKWFSIVVVSNDAPPPPCPHRGAVTLHVTWKGSNLGSVYIFVVRLKAASFFYLQNRRSFEIVKNVGSIFILNDKSCKENVLECTEAIFKREFCHKMAGAESFYEM